MKSEEGQPRDEGAKTQILSAQKSSGRISCGGLYYLHSGEGRVKNKRCSGWQKDTAILQLMEKSAKIFVARGV
jgi:hypothetical protein